ncbi:ROK family transcriptional regulator [Brachybacterium sacelli]|uniref:NBD/HSP70 family sugar kinase n=1 Tax=Brachybacterium sacelli TaxID=173364 RepID=A0ABS4WZ46_9MICO|nr:ROK family transcriptional regulator [Brachybacterium sacelli]MBP2381487.1 putative NBD/HSP70 family sugar kinase [Brachybacterium sacelli]
MTTGTTRPLRGAEHEILLALRLHGPSTRADLVQRTGLSRATVSTATARLLTADRITSAGTAPARRSIGRTPERLALSISGAVILGVEFGHRRVTVTAMDEAHYVEGSATAVYEQDTSWPHRIRHAFELLDGLGVPDRRAVIAVGLGVPGRIPDRERVTDSLVATFASRVAREVRVDNNARLAGLAESVWGAGRDLQSFIYLRLMDGVGGALVTHGTIYDGLHGTAGEFGHITVDPAGPECRCGKRGCLEAYVSRERILEATAHRDLDVLREVLDAGDARRREIVAGAGRRIGVVLANTCTSLDVEGVVLGGDLVTLGRHLTAPLEAAFSENLMPARAHRIALHPGRIRQVDGALGGIALVLRDHTIALSRPDSPTGAGYPALAKPSECTVSDRKGRLSS